MLYKLHRYTVVLIVPMFFANISPAYERFIWIPIFLNLFFILRASIVSPLSELSIKWQMLLTVVVAVGVALLAKACLALDQPAFGLRFFDEMHAKTLPAPDPSVFKPHFSDLGTYIKRCASLLIYPHIGAFKLEDILSPKAEKKAKKKYLMELRPLGLRSLYAGLIALAGVAIYFADPFSLVGGLRGDGALLSIFVLSICSLTSAELFYRLDPETIGKDGTLYNIWLVVPAFILSTVFFLLVCIEGARGRPFMRFGDTL
jgi:hypothetical protein